MIRARHWVHDGGPAVSPDDVATIHAGYDVPGSASQFPVLLFSHGLLGLPELYLNFISDMASQVRPSVSRCTFHTLSHT